jgi:hypothetical protein
VKLLVVLLMLVAAEGGGASLKDIYARGETLDFDLSWSRISGGAARMTIAPITGDRYRITSVGKSGTFFSNFFKVRDEIESIVDREDFSTLEYHKILYEGRRHKVELTVVDERRNVAFRKGKAIPVPHPIFDPLSLIYYIRLLDLSAGKTHDFTIIADGKVYTVQTRIVNRETITTPAGEFKTVVIEPKMESRSGVFRDEQSRLLIWYSDDYRHLPVLIRSDVKIGSITATLRGTKSGVDSIEPETRKGQ